MRGKVEREVGHVYMVCWDGKAETSIHHRREEGETVPAIVFHGKETTMGKIQNKSGVSMDVEGTVRPSTEG